MTANPMMKPRVATVPDSTLNDSAFAARVFSGLLQLRLDF